MKKSYNACVSYPVSALVWENTKSMSKKAGPKNRRSTHTKTHTHKGSMGKRTQIKPVFTTENTLAEMEFNKSSPYFLTSPKLDSLLMNSNPVSPLRVEAAE